MSTEAEIKTSLTYSDPDEYPDFATDFPGEPAPVPTLIKPHPTSVQVPYDFVVSGSLLVEDGSEDDTLAIDLGDIDEVTGFHIRNDTAQDVNVSLNGDDVTWALPSGGALTMAMPASSGAPITSIDIITTAIQSGDQYVRFHIFGVAST